MSVKFRPSSQQHTVVISHFINTAGGVRNNHAGSDFLTTALSLKTKKCMKNA